MSALVFEALRLLRAGLRPHVLRPGSKAPLATGWQAESDWSSEAVKARFDAAPEGAGLGIRTGEGLVVIDVDVKGKDGMATLARLESQLGLLPASVRVRTPSGGLHIYLRSSAALHSTVEALGPGVDTRAAGGQVAAPPTPGYSWLTDEGAEVERLPEQWLLALQAVQADTRPTTTTASSTLRRDGDRELGRRRAQAYLATMPPAVSGRGGHAQTLSAACRAVELCIDANDVREVMSAYNARCEPPWSSQELQHKVAEALRLHALGERFDAIGPSLPAEKNLLWVEALQAYVARSDDRLTWHVANPLGKEAAVGALVSGAGMEAGAARAALANWDANYVEYVKKVDCDPTKPALYSDEHGNKVANTYVRPTLAPRSGSYPVIGEVLTFLCDGDEGARLWFFNWLARAVQKPGERIKTSPIIRSRQGSGKSPLALIIGHILGAKNCFTARNEDVHGRFNAHFAQKLLLVVDELRAAESNDATPRLKYLTGSPTLSVEAKGASGFETKNRVKLIGLSNDTQPVCDESGGTRFTHLENFKPVPDAYRQRIATLFTGPASGDLNAAGLAEAAAFAHDLLAHRVDEEKVNTPYDNAARASAMAASRPSVEAFADEVTESSLDAIWAEVVPEHERRHYDGFKGIDARWDGHAGCVSHSALYSTYVCFCKARGQRAVGSSRFANELARQRPAWVREKPNLYRLDGSRERVVVYTGIPRDLAARGLVVPRPPAQGAAHAGLDTAQQVLMNAFPGSARVLA